MNIKRQRRRLAASLAAAVALAVSVSACGQADMTTAGDPAGGEGGSATGSAAHAHGGHEGAGHGGMATSGDQKAEAAAEAARAEWSLSTDNPTANGDFAIRVRITDAEGKPVEKFKVNHEKLMHLIVVSEDLSYFDHLHPTYEGDGRFEAKTSLPAAGRYKLIADYIPEGGAETTASRWIRVRGNSPELRAIAPDKTLVRTVDGVKATLSPGPGALKAGEETTLTFRLSDAKSGEPIRDLEPYLGAVGHVVILSADTEKYLHVHPIDEKAKGPDAAFRTAFPAPGVYKIWGQFQRGGRSFVVPFVVQVS